MSYIDYKFIEDIKKTEKTHHIHLLKKLLSLYLTHVPRSIEKLMTHFKNGEFEELKNESHKFKSSSGNVGAFEIHRICQEIENEIAFYKNPSHEVLSRLMWELEEKIIPTTQELTQIMHSVES